MSVPDIATVSPAAWDEARRFLPIIRRLADDPTRTRADVEAGAAELGCGPTHVYALIRRYIADPRLTSLLPRKRGPSAGFSRLENEVDALVDEAIDGVYLTRQSTCLRARSAAEGWPACRGNGRMIGRSICNRCLLRGRRPASCSCQAWARSSGPR
ncbi:hypothetical protein [Mesorhizobium carmichaelinearum]|uniref:hypothetical protein n=1 Tax=Mesorhizobium carmichaelinearum TaxID=1208188 RepID=UPI001FCE403B|nr:hypothetical protein [Mesorhizobium carmichaelinearum]